MSVTLRSAEPRADVPPRHAAERTIAVGRAVLALAWAAATALAIGGGVTTTSSELPVAASLLVAAYPVIDVSASLLVLRYAHIRVLRLNAAISGLAAVALAVAAFDSDAAAVLVVFGAWAAVSGAMQLVMAIRRRHVFGRQLAMVVSGGLSTIAGLSFVAAASRDDANLLQLAGYMTLGALLYLVWAGQGGRSHRMPRARHA